MIELEMPWPVPQVWPNYRNSHHWRSYEGHVKAQRIGAEAIAKQCQPNQSDYEVLAGLGRIPVEVEFYPPDRRHRDDDGMVGAFKSARDGIADALNVNDRRFQATYRVMEPVKPGRVVVRIGAAIPKSRCALCGS